MKPGNLLSLPVIYRYSREQLIPSSVEAVETDSSTYKSYSWQNPVYSEQDVPVLPTRTYSAQSFDTASTVEELKETLRYDFDQRITDISNTRCLLLCWELASCSFSLYWWQDADYRPKN